MNSFRSYILILAFFFIITKSKGQLVNVPIHLEIHVDFETMEISYDEEKLKNINLGDYYVIKVKNINSNLYQINFGNKDSSQTEPLAFPTFANLPIDGLTKAITGMNSIGGKIATPSLPINDTPFSNKYVQIGELKDGLEKKFERDIDMSTTIKYILFDNKEFLTRSLENLYKTQFELLKDINKIQNIYLNNLILDNSKTFGVNLNIKTILESLQNHENSLEKIIFEILEMHADFNEKTKQIQFLSIINNDKQLETLYQHINTSYEEFVPAILKVRDPILGENRLKLLTLILPAINQKSQPYTSLPIQFTNEVTELNVKITPRRQDLGLFEYTTKIQFPIKDRLTFWGLSSGFFIGYPSNQAYSVRLIHDTNTYELITEKPGEVEIGFNTMIRKGWAIKKSESEFFQIGFGPGITFSDRIRPRMLLGAGFAFGKKHSILVDIGAITGYYDVKSEAFSNITTLREPPQSLTSPKLRMGGYLSLSYLFLK